MTIMVTVEEPDMDFECKLIVSIDLNDLTYPPNFKNYFYVERKEWYHETYLSICQAKSVDIAYEETWCNYDNIRDYVDFHIAMWNSPFPEEINNLIWSYLKRINKLHEVDELQLKRPDECVFRFEDGQIGLYDYKTEYIIWREIDYSFYLHSRAVFYTLKVLKLADLHTEENISKILCGYDKRLTLEVQYVKKLAENINKTYVNQWKEGLLYNENKIICYLFKKYYIFKKDLYLKHYIVTWPENEDIRDILTEHYFYLQNHIEQHPIDPTNKNIKRKEVKTVKYIHPYEIIDQFREDLIAYYLNDLDINFELSLIGHNTNSIAILIKQESKKWLKKNKMFWMNFIEERMEIDDIVI